MKSLIYKLLRNSERYTKADMIYFAKGGFWSNMNFIVSSIVGLVLSVAFANLVSKETYGTYQYILSFISIVGVFSLAGMNPAITQSVSRGFEGTLKSSIWPQFKWNGLVASLSLGLSIYYFLNNAPIFGWSFLISSVLIPINNVANSYIAYLSGKKEFKRIFIYSSYFNFVYLGVMIFVATSNNALILVISYLTLSTVTNIILYFFALRKVPPNDNNDPQALPYAKHLSLMNILGTIAQKIDSILVFHYLGAAELAIYSFSKIIPDKVLAFFKSFLGTALPKLSSKKPSDIKINLQTQIWQLIFISLVVALGLFFVLPLVYKILFPNYIDSIFFAGLYSFSMVAIAAQLPSIVLISQKATKELYLVNTVNPIIHIVILFVMVTSFGILGAVLAKVVNQILSLFIFWLITNIKLRSS